MICPNCGTLNPDNAKFCIECGQPLPRRCPNCGMLNPAGARFCSQCGEPLAVPTPAPASSALVAAETPGAISANLDGVATMSVPDEADVTSAAELDTLDEQRRIVTVLFADLTSSTTLADTLDAEDVRMLLAGFFAAMTHEIHRHGGTVEKYIGDAVMAVFGLPLAHEDDPIRAVRAALDMRAALRRFNGERRAADPTASELQMRIGINTGEVVAASGSAEGRDFLITGDPVNVASRLQQAASPGAILVGPRTYRGTIGSVVYGEPRPIDVRGKPRPILVWEVLSLAEDGAAPAPRPRGVRGMRTPLIGREVELNLLRTVYTRVINERRPHLVTIIGVPGVGKTRLAREFISTTNGTNGNDGNKGRGQPLVLIGRCPPYGESVTYWPLAEMLRAYCGFSAFDAPDVARARLLESVRAVLRVAGRSDDPEVIAAYLGHTIGIESAKRRQALLPADGQQLQEGLLRAWRVFFEALAVQRLLLVMVDDIHWADDTLLDLLDYVVSRAASVPLLLLCPARPELLERHPGWGGGKRNYVTIGLEPLSPGDSERLVRELLPGEDVPESLRAGILAKAEGNPFYVEEIVRMLVDRGILVSDDEVAGAWRVASEWEGSSEVSDPAIPDTVQGVLAARLDLLSSDERETLQHAAVIGRYFWPGALRALRSSSAHEDLSDVLASLQSKDLIHESVRPEASIAPTTEPLYTFNHALTREVAYSTVPRTRRAHEHERFAEWLERLAQGREVEFADLLAQHYRQYYVQANLARARNSARRQAVRDKVIYYLALAGDQAMTRHAATKAVRYYSGALDLLAQDALAEDVPYRVVLFMKRGEARWEQVRGDESWGDFREALRLWSAYSAFMVDGLADARLAASANGSGTYTVPLPPQDGASAANLRAALPLDWRGRGLRLYRLLVELPTRNGGFFQQTPSHEELLTYLNEGLRLADELGQRDTLEYAELLAAKAFFWWSWAEKRGEDELLDALRSAREAVRITEELGDPRAASAALDALGNMQAITTDLRGYAESEARRLQWARCLDDLSELEDIHSEVCRAYMLVGEYTAAIQQGEYALELAKAGDADPLRRSALRSLVLAHFEADHWQETVQLSQQLRQHLAHADSPHSYQLHWALLAWAIALARMGKYDEADSVAQRVFSLSERREVQFIGLFHARLALARGALKEARQLLLGALDAQSGRFILPALLAELAELGARNGDRELYERFGSQAQELGWRSGARKALAQAIRARGIVAVADSRWEDALADLQSALSRYHTLGTAWEEARTRYALAGCYQRRQASGDAALAHDELAQALTLFEAMHAIRDTARAKAALAGSEVRLP